jgi:hypothetical protein
MNESQQNISIVQLLVEEKKLVYQEKLQAIKTTKGILGLFIPFLTSIFAIAVHKEAHALFLLVPFVTSSIALYLLSNLHTQNIILEYLDRLDRRINYELNQELPFYQYIIDEILPKSGPYIAIKFKQFNHYFLFGILLTLISGCICVWSIIQGNTYLVLEIKFYSWNYIFVILSILTILLTLYTFIRYGISYGTLRNEMFDEKMPTSFPKKTPEF